VTDGPDVLLVGGAEAGAEVARHLPPEAVRVCEDPWEGLRLLAQRPWAAVVLADILDDFPALCRAARRLGGGARLVGLCGPGREPEVGSLVPAALDGYELFPPQADALRRLLAGGEAQSGPGASADGGAAVAAGTEPGAAPAPGAIQPGEWAELIGAATSVLALQSHLSAWLGRRLGIAVVWRDLAEAPPDQPALLALGGRPAQMLLGCEPAALDGAAEALLAEVQSVLPALEATARRTETLRRQAITDPLTGAYNRRYFYEAAERILLRGRQRDLRITLLLYDIDDFKRYNGTYGYAAGDEILRETAGLIRRITRAQDLIARIGGDEFAVLFWDPQPPREPDSQPLDTAYDLADRFRHAVETQEFHSLGPEARGVLSISGGLARFPEDGGEIRELLRSADQALRTAKQSGKNSIVLAGR